MATTASDVAFLFDKFVMQRIAFWKKFTSSNPSIASQSAIEQQADMRAARRMVGGKASAVRLTRSTFTLIWGWKLEPEG
jgi:hypothetical protein